jgi:organic hydroperoxide reductase OsmC/OhrA
MAHHYRCLVEWTGAADGPTTDAKTFSRASRVTFAERPPVETSAAPEFGGDAGRVNPEELFTASLATCQMLSYLYLAARQGVRVLAYTDDAVGELAVRAGKLRMTRVTLHPIITIAAASDPDLARTLVERAHDECFIANSVTCEVSAEAQILTQ